jgi:membrane-bound lytic murein transglycosylase A
VRLSRLAASVVALAAWMGACRPVPSPTPLPTPMPSPTPELARVEPPPLTDDLARESLAAAIDRDLEASDRIGTADCPGPVVAQALKSLRRAAARPETDFLQYVATRFEFRRSTGREDGALFTGYYEPVLAARQRPEAGFVYPLYRRPGDLIEIRLGDFDPAWSDVTVWGRVADGKLAPYYTRRQIDREGALAGRGLELAWLDDPVARYFLQVQGSGVLRLGDGSLAHVGFAGSNGKPYTSIGRLLADEGVFAGQPATAPAIQAYLRAHPERRDDVLFRNERYVFFVETPDGPVGRLGVKLTGGRSIAVDPTFYPLGWLAYVDTTAPVVDASGKTTGSRPLRRLALLQDSGAAITGAGRADIFFGTGEQSGLEAGSMSQRGQFYLLTPIECRG